MYNAALSAWRADRILDAEKLCRAAILASPDSSSAHYLLSLIEFSLKRASQAKTSLCDALARSTSASEALEFASALLVQGRTEDGRATLRHALKLDPALAAAHFYLSNTFGPQDAEQAEAHLRQAIHLEPSLAEAHNNLGNLLRASRPGEAQASYEQAIALRPGFAQAWFNLGILLENTEPKAAENALRRAVDLNPGFAPAWNALACLLPDSRWREARDALMRAVEIDPCFAVAWSNLAHRLSRTNRAEAEGAARRAIALNPNLVSAYYNLGVLLGRACSDEAIRVLRHAVALKPDHANAWYQLGHLLSFDDPAEALVALRKAIDLNPGMANAHAVLGNVFLAMGSAEESVAALRRSLECDPGNIVAHANLIFVLPCVSDCPEVVMHECTRFAARHEAPVVECARGHLNDSTPDRRLRVGYVSPDFDSHCQSFFTIPLLSNHNHTDFEIICYSSVEAPDHVTASIRGLADVWRDVRLLDDEALAQQIRADRVDILVDLTMHMEGCRRLLFARRPAPVQVAWLAYPGTTGSPAMDYRLSDCWLDPLDEPGREAWYSERTIRLPRTFWCYDPLLEDLAVNSLPAANGAPFTFGCLNNPAKASDHALGLWAGALAAVPESRLLVLEPQGVPRASLMARYVAQGIDSSRVSFIGRQSRRAYLETWRRIDLALDSFPCNGHTTSLDAFWMGVPVVTRAGCSAISRGGKSIARNLALPELVAHSDDDFVRAARAFACDLPRLAALRGTLRERMEASALMDAPRFAADIEQAYRGMWREYCASHRHGAY
ncbi:tetratricopeptide repeat protein [Paraburkholderia tagetis]|uniref:protein O-GlcNAc transferase n=1 Tax=Paraburkholderia tagetis TaxID=2913261 RepID=A0A9X1UDV9_9BURK|nr:tetratricopeptide repeat protein [Paraburkholderia tagetis]MCG5072535.1 tetratricopeptide repeat protein [Paraburkholderia tagetis]